MRSYAIIELIIVFIVIAILAILALPTFEKMLEKTKEADAKSVLGVIRRQQEVYYTETGSYADTFEDLLIEKPISKYWDFAMTNAYGRDVGPGGPTGQPGFTAAAWRKGKDIQFHIHERGEIARTLNPSNYHEHEEGGASHRHDLPSP